MRHQADPYSYADPWSEPMSLDAFVISDGIISPPPVMDRALGADEQVALAQAETAIQKFIQSLDARDQTLVERIFWHDQRQADVARALNVSNAAVSKRMSRIVERGRVELASLRDSMLQ